MLGALNSIPILAAENPIQDVVDHGQLFIGHTAIVTNHMILMLIVAGLMLLIFPWLTKEYRSGNLVPTGTRNFFEAILMYLREEVIRPVLGNETDRFVPFLWTLFFFILFNNLLGLLPIGAITAFFWPKGELPNGQERYPILGAATADIYVTGGLAIVAFFVMQINGIRANGLGKYLAHFTGGAPIYMAPLMIPVEIIGMFVKPFALALRLFANMNAGHVLLAVLIGFVATGLASLGTGAGLALSIPIVAGATAIMCLELFVAVLQAYIFMFLTCLFIGQLVVHEHDPEHDEGGHHDESHGVIGGGDLTDADKFPDAARQAGAHMAG